MILLDYKSRIPIYEQLYEGIVRLSALGAMLPGEQLPSVRALAQELGYKSIFWSFAYADWDTQNVAEPAAALQKVTESTHPGAIFLLHAVSPTNAEILGQAIDSIRSQGYTFTTAL